MSVKFNKDKYNGYYATVNGQRFRGKTKEIILDKIKMQVGLVILNLKVS